VLGVRHGETRNCLCMRFPQAPLHDAPTLRATCAWASWMHGEQLPKQGHHLRGLFAGYRLPSQLPVAGQIADRQQLGIDSVDQMPGFREIDRPHGSRPVPSPLPPHAAVAPQQANRSLQARPQDTPALRSVTPQRRLRQFNLFPLLSLPRENQALALPMDTERLPGELADFHSQRHTYISAIVAGGASVKTAQELCTALDSVPNDRPVLPRPAARHIGRLGSVAESESGQAR